MRNLFRRRWWLVVPIAVGLAVAAAVWHQNTRLPKRFAAVVAGRLYRSGSVSPVQLDHLRREYDIRRVICLLASDAEVTQSERQAAQQLGIEWHNVPLAGDGSSTPADRRRIRALLLAEPPEGATLVHCAAGSNRTGLAIGMYRLHHDGWPLDRVLDEMRAFGFKDKPHHENLRRALAAEAAAAAIASRPAAAP